MKDSQESKNKKKSPFADFFTERIRFMAIQGQRLSKIDQNGLKGRFRELLIRDILELLVPKTCSVTSGTVEDSFGTNREKTEDDILIVDRECLPPFFEYKKEGIYPIESVLARIEVKSAIGKNEFKDAIRGAYEFSKLKPNIPDIKEDESMQRQTVQVLFGYKSKWSRLKDDDKFINELDTLTKEIIKKDIKVNGNNKIESRFPFIRHICIPGVRYLVYTQDDENGEGWYKCDAKENEYREVLAFIALLLQELPGVRELRRKATLGRYIECLRQNKLEKISLKEK